VVWDTIITFLPGFRPRNHTVFTPVLQCHELICQYPVVSAHLVVRLHPLTELYQVIMRGLVILSRGEFPDDLVDLVQLFRAE
jgi:hypothetical protein